MVGRGNGKAAAPPSGLGPRGRGIFDRLFGGRGTTAPAAARQEACTVAIGSGKGGTGKSFLASNLAILAHRRARAVTLVDCDFGLACAHLLLGVTPRLTMQHLLAGSAALADVRVPTPAGPWLVPGGSGVRQMASLSDRDLQALGRELSRLAAADDVLMLDVGAGIAPQAVLTMLCADHVVLVTQPEIAALTDAYAVVKCLVQLDANVRLGVVVNRVTGPGQGEQVYGKLAEVADRHAGAQLYDLGEVPDDPMVTHRRLGQQPIVVSEPERPICLALEGVLDRLQAWTGGLARRQAAPGGDLEARFRQHRLFV